MHKILSINGTSFFSTGTIIKTLESQLSDCYSFFRMTADEYEAKNFKTPRNFFERQLGKVFCQAFGEDGFGFGFSNKRVKGYLEGLRPDLIHIHNLHGYWINSETVLAYAFQNNVPLVFTLHDCWPFTGRCAHFFESNCDKWKVGCGHCPAMSAYPRARFLDLSGQQWTRKKRLLMNRGIWFVSPSNWLASFFRESFLKNERISVINNGIRVSFYEDVPEKKHVETNKRIVLFVANPFTKEKGLEDVNRLADILNEDYQVVCVGDPAGGSFSEKIINIPATKDAELLAQLYKQADCFGLFSHQENYPTVLMEAIACGTPIVSYDVGGCGEICEEGVNGFLVGKGNVQLAAKRIADTRLLNKRDIQETGKKHDLSMFAAGYKKIYDELLTDDKTP